MSRGLGTLDDAVQWLRDTWSTRDVPVRLHSSDTGDDGAPAFHPAFARHLDAKPGDVTYATTTRRCAHPRLSTSNAWDCPDCQGAGVYESTTLVYRYPMWRAMDELHRRKLWAHDVVLTLVINAFVVSDVLDLMAVREKRVLEAVRSLYAIYQQAPSGGRSLGWVSKSDSQRQAETQQFAVVPV